VKHIKSKMIFESSNLDQIKDDLNDICLDLTDNGFINGPFYKYPTLNKYHLILQKNGENDTLDLFKYSDVSETLDRIKRYLGDKLLDMKAWRPDNNRKSIVRRIHLNLDETSWTWVDVMDEPLNDLGYLYAIKIVFSA